MLLGIRLIETTFWCGLSNHQAATAEMHLVQNDIVECLPIPLRSTSPFSDRWMIAMITYVLWDQGYQNIILRRGGPRGVDTTVASYSSCRGFQEYCWRVPFRHPSLRRIAKQLKTSQTNIRRTRYLIRRMDKPYPRNT